MKISEAGVGLLYGMPMSHILSIVKAAQKENAIFAFRPVHPLAHSFIEEGYPTKPFALKIKTAQKNLAALLLTVDPDYSRADSKSDYEKHTKAVAKALKEGVQALPLTLKVERLNELLKSSFTIRQLKINNDFIFYFTKKVDTVEKEIVMKAITKNSREYSIVNNKDNPVLVLSMNDQYITTDYDLFFIAFSYEKIDFSKKYQTPFRTQTLEEIEKSLSLIEICNSLLSIHETISLQLDQILSRFSIKQSCHEAVTISNTLTSHLLNFNPDKNSFLLEHLTKILPEILLQLSISDYLNSATKLRALLQEDSNNLKNAIIQFLEKAVVLKNSLIKAFPAKNSLRILIQNGLQAILKTGLFLTYPKEDALGGNWSEAIKNCAAAINAQIGEDDKKRLDQRFKMVHHNAEMNNPFADCNVQNNFPCLIIFPKPFDLSKMQKFLTEKNQTLCFTEEKGTKTCINNTSYALLESIEELQMLQDIIREYGFYLNSHYAYKTYLPAFKGVTTKCIETFLQKHSAKNENNTPSFTITITSPRPTPLNKKDTNRENKENINPQSFLHPHRLFSSDAFSPTPSPKVIANKRFPDNSTKPGHARKKSK